MEARASTPVVVVPPGGKYELSVVGDAWDPLRGAEGYRLSPAAGRLRVTDADGREVFDRGDLPAGTEITFDEETIRIAEP